LAAATAPACGGDDAPTTGFTSGGTEVGDGDGDPSGNETGTTGNTTSADGDGDGDPSGDGDGDPSGDGDGAGDGDGDGDGEDEPCMTDADCDGATPVCDGNGECVPCTPDNDVCDIGQYCAPDNTCIIGCANDEDCPDPLVCGPNNTCTGCAMDANCALGSICDEGECVPGCTDQQPCAGALSCCSGVCEDLLNDPEFCGSCDDGVCPDYPNAISLCTAGTCEMGECVGNWNDCNGNPADGCETQAQCACAPGEQISCYTGFPANTQDVGVCKAGLRTCNAQGTGYGACTGQVIPSQEICGSGQDENCNGQVDENPDLDGDGWGVCDGDCCDQVSPQCSTPNLVNPGAFEVPGNGVDDDCDGIIDNPVPLCDGGLASNSATPNDYARAIDLCQFTTENPPLPDKKWGVINSWLHRGDGTNTPSAEGRSIRPQFGTNITPQAGQRIAVMSSGRASYPGQTLPGYTAWQNGFNQGNQFNTNAPADWLAANNGAFPNAPGCPGANSTVANDSVMYKVRVRVPTNANSFSTKMFFFSAEYPEYVCTTFNDMFIALVDSSNGANPNDKNIAIYSQGGNQWPVGVNLVKAAPGLFTQCTNGQISQCGTVSNYNGCVNTTLLTGTGFDTVTQTNLSCGYNGMIGGGTGWLTMSGNVTPGEVMEIRFVIWDTADSLFDSVVLLDDWRWSVQASEPGVSPG